ncbi:MAG: SDR family NAD(P)-dependent oxidoreductase [Jatrophihabitantaceae bacterium]
MSEYTGRTVLVTGTSGALGSGLAAAFADAGARVIGVDRAAPDVRAHVDGVRYESADLTDDARVGALFDALLDGPLDGPGAPWAVINTVGGFAPHTPIASLDVDELTRQLTLNLVTAAVLTKHALRVMQPVGAGRIVHTASRAATVPSGSGFAYSVSKLGVLRLVRMAAEEVAGSAITVNAVVPSIIDTPANRAGMPDADHASWPKIADLARSYLYLASPRAALVNGAALPV